MLIPREYTMVVAEKQTEAYHASTVLPLDNGRVLVAWFGGSREGADDVGIWLSVRDARGFGVPKLIDRTDEPHWNPVLYRRADGTILLFYKVGREIPDWRTMVTKSRDGGRSFTVPEELVPGDVSGGRGPVKNKPLRTRGGSLLAPASVERGVWRCFIDRSTDDGITWTRTAPIEVPGLEDYERALLRWQTDKNAPMPIGYRHGHGVIQPSLWEDDEGSHALMRSGEGMIYRSDSRDDGITWTQAYPTDIPNNNSGIDLTRLPDGTLLLAYNPVGDNFGSRSPLSLAVSKDGARTWERILDVETIPGEFSYPAVVSAGDRVYMTYTYDRRNIAYREFEWKV